MSLPERRGASGKQARNTLDEILAKINERYKGQFTDSDRVMIDALHQKLIKNDKLAKSARTANPTIFTEGIFPSAFEMAAMDGFRESQESYESLFRDKSKYQAVMGALAGVIYREMRADSYPMMQEGMFMGAEGTNAGMAAEN